jgi:hypothetical protein
MAKAKRSTPSSPSRGVAAIHVTTQSAKIDASYVREHIGTSQTAARRIGRKLVGIFIFCPEFTDPALREAYDHEETYGISVDLIRLPKDIPPQDFIREYFAQTVQSPRVTKQTELLTVSTDEDAS